MKVLFVGYRYLEHSKFGGYDWITNFKDSFFLDVRKMPFGKLFQKHGGRIPLFLTYIACFFQSRRCNLVHFFYGDRCSCSRKLLAKKTKVVATVHLKSDDFPDKWINKFKRYDSIVCLSSDEERKLRDKGLPAHFIPHGFNPPVFKLVEASSLGFDENHINVCFLGSNYRDYNTFLTIADFLQERRTDITFHCLGQSKDFKEKASMLKNVKTYLHLNDDLYYSMIKNCDYSFMPLLFATANNALLEAQSLGLVSILPKIQGILDYANANENIFYENLDECMNYFLHMRKSQKSLNLVEFSKKYEWKNIYSELDSLYRDIAQ